MMRGCLAQYLHSIDGRIQCVKTMPISAKHQYNNEVELLFNFVGYWDKLSV